MVYPSLIIHLSSLPKPTTIKNHRTVAFTTPHHYAERLSHLITLRKWTPIWSPTIVIESTPQTNSNLLNFLPSSTRIISPLNSFSSIAFTSRAGITAFHTALAETCTPPPPLSPSPNNSSSSFTVCALGKDAELLDSEFITQLCGGGDFMRQRVRILVPPIASPSGLVNTLGEGRGRRVLCPVPRVVGLTEPPVVPDFLRELRGVGWDAVRVEAYETKWIGPDCVERLLELGLGLDAIVFTSTAEVEGLLKGLRELGLSWAEFRRRNGVIVATHGPITAAGAERLGVNVDVVSSKFGSFEGVVQELGYCLG